MYISDKYRHLRQGADGFTYSDKDSYLGEGADKIMYIRFPRSGNYLSHSNLKFLNNVNKNVLRTYKMVSKENTRRMIGFWKFPWYLIMSHKSLELAQGSCNFFHVTNF